MSKISTAISAIKNNWGKAVLFVVFVAVFVVMLFPLDDLGDFVSSQVAKLTQNNVYVRFDHMGLTVVPQPGIQLNQVYVETSTLPSVSVNEMTLTPSFSGILNQKPFGHFSAKGFMKGNVDVSVSAGKRSDDGKERLNLSVDAEKLNLYDIKEFAQLPVSIRGQLSFSVKDGQIDPLFAEQPDANMVVTIDRFELPASNVPTAMGPVTLPELKLAQVELNGRLVGGKLTINNGTIGKAGDEIQGTVKGNLGLTLQNNNGLIVPQIGGYSVELDLNIKKSFEDKASLFLSFLEKYKTTTADGGRYRFKMTAANTQAPPSMEALR